MIVTRSQNKRFFKIGIAHHTNTVISNYNLRPRKVTKQKVTYNYNLRSLKLINATLQRTIVSHGYNLRSCAK